MTDKTMLKLLYPNLWKIYEKDFLDFMPFEEGGGAISAKYEKEEACFMIQDYEMREFGLSKEEVVELHMLELAYLNYPDTKNTRIDFDWVVSRITITPFPVWAYFV